MNIWEKWGWEDENILNNAMWSRLGKEDYGCPSVTFPFVNSLGICVMCTNMSSFPFNSRTTSHLVIFGHKSIANFVLKAGQKLLRLHIIILHIFSVDRIQIGEKLNIATDKTYWSSHFEVEIGLCHAQTFPVLIQALFKQLLDFGVPVKTQVIVENLQGIFIFSQCKLLQIIVLNYDFFITTFATIATFFYT